MQDSLRLRLAEALKSVPGVIIWPALETDIPDGREEFQTVWLGPEYAEMTAIERQTRMETLLRSHGQTRREFRNALAFVIPAAAGEGSISYAHLVLPFPGVGYMSTLELRAFPFAGGEITLSASEAEVQAIAGRLMEALSPQLSDRLSAPEIARQIGLGGADPTGAIRRCFPVEEIPRWYFSFPSMPKIQGLNVLDRAVRMGFASGLFGLIESSGLVELSAIPERVEGRLLLGQAADRAFRFGRGQWLTARVPSAGGVS